MSSSDAKNVHAGHRQRLRQRAMENGAFSFLPHEILELLLTYCIDRRDVNPLAHALIDRFGSLHAVLEADLHELRSVPGVGDTTAAFLHVLGQLPGYLTWELFTGERYYIRSPYDAARRLHAYFRPMYAEKSVLISMDRAGRVLHLDPVSYGDDQQTPLPPREAINLAVRHHAYTIILAHNHPSGNVEPSKEDISTTETLSDALKLYDISIADHIIFSETDYYSMYHHREYHFPRKTRGIPLHDAPAAPILSDPLLWTPAPGPFACAHQDETDYAGVLDEKTAQRLFPFSSSDAEKT